MERYVVGFAFDNYHDVLLIEKTKPKWQAGLLNGVGGKIEDSDISDVDAMVREFQEETTLWTEASNWNYVVTMRSDDWEVLVYSMFDKENIYRTLDGSNTDTDETIRVMNYRYVLNNEDCISNLGWLVGLCFDQQVPVDYNVIFNQER